MLIHARLHKSTSKNINPKLELYLSKGYGYTYGLLYGELDAMQNQQKVSFRSIHNPGFYQY